MAWSRVHCFMPLFVAAHVSIPSKLIAPGVQMPVMSIGDGGEERNESATITQTWLKMGGRGIDTAYMYGNQKTVAQSIAESGVERKEVFLTSKVPGCANTSFYVESILSDLATDYIDLMLIHVPWWGNCTEAWATLEAFHAKGVLKAIGVSNYQKSDLDALMETAKVKPAVHQMGLNVLQYDAEALNASQSYNITVEAYSPLGRGGKCGCISSNKVIQKVASAHNVTTYQVALKWILQHDHILTFQSVCQEHQQSNADVFNFTLSANEMSLLDQLHKPGPGFLTTTTPPMYDSETAFFEAEESPVIIA